MKNISQILLRGMGKHVQTRPIYLNLLRHVTVALTVYCFLRRGVLVRLGKELREWKNLLQMSSTW